MAVCENCEKHGKKMVDCFTKLERLAIFADACSSLRYVKDKNDKLIKISIVTKALLSFDVKSRFTLIQYAKQNFDMDLSINDCPHGKLALVTP